MSETAPHRRIGLAHHLLDHQLLDSRSERCGKVDDVALVARDGTVYVDGVLSGPGALRARAGHRSSRWLFGLAGRGEVFVSWRDVSQIVDHVTLARPAPAIGLSRGEQHAAEVVARVLGTDAHAARLGPDEFSDSEPPEDDVVRLSGVLGTRVVDASGTDLGRVREVRARKDGPLLSEAAGTAWRVTGIELGVGGFMDRLGLPGRRRRRREIDAATVEDWHAAPLRLRA